MKDLGTYHVRVEFADGDGFWFLWDTGGRFTHANEFLSPLTAEWIEPTWDDEGDVLSGIAYQFLEGNYSCDCNRQAFLDLAHHRERVRHPCGDQLVITKLTVRAPDGRLVELNPTP